MHTQIHVHTHTCIHAHTHKHECSGQLEEECSDRHDVPICESVAHWLDHVGWEARRGMWFVRGHEETQGGEEEEVEAWEGTALSPQGPAPAPCDCCLGDGWGLSGMPRAHILPLDSWMEQKGVDGFSLSVSSFHIQQIRAVGCCGDDTEDSSRTPAPQTEPANVDLGHPGGQVLLWETQQQQQQTAKRVKERGGGRDGRGGEGVRKGRKYTTVSSNGSVAL